MSSSPVVISAAAKHTASVIFLHGLGDTGHGWAAALQMQKLPHVKYICPTASVMPVTLNAGFRILSCPVMPVTLNAGFRMPSCPVMPVTLNAGFRMPSWFDLKSLDSDGPEDEEGIKKASEAVFQLIAEEEEKGIPSNRIVLGGFSQGGALAMYSALRYSKPLAGVVALSCWLPLFKQFPAAAVGNTDIPLMQCHGELDTVVQYKWGKMTHELLKTFMSNVELKTYKDLCHTSSEEEMKDVKSFLERVIP